MLKFIKGIFEYIEKFYTKQVLKRYLKKVLIPARYCSLKNKNKAINLMEDLIKNIYILSIPEIAEYAKQIKKFEDKMIIIS